MTRKLSTVLCTAGGVFSTCALSLLPIMLVLALIAGPEEHRLSDKLLRAAVYALFILPGAAFLNMANFFTRLKRSNPDLYSRILRNQNWFEYAGRAGRSLLVSLHLRISELGGATGEALTRGLRMYARLTRYANLGVLAYVILGGISIIGFAVIKR